MIIIYIYNKHCSTFVLLISFKTDVQKTSFRMKMKLPRLVHNDCTEYYNKTRHVYFIEQDLECEIALQI